MTTSYDIVKNQDGTFTETTVSGKVTTIRHYDDADEVRQIIAHKQQQLASDQQTLSQQEAAIQTRDAEIQSEIQEAGAAVGA